MDKSPDALLKKLVETPSPSGYEHVIQRVVREHLKSVADEITTDVHGNVIACKNPGAELRVMLDAHCDQIGMVVSHIDESGFVYAQTIGGWDPQQLVGQRMTIWSAQGETPAVIARKPIHLLDDAERKQVVKIEDLWLDIGAESEEQAKQMVKVGDAVTLRLGLQEMPNGLANAPGMDDRTGVWVVLEAFRRAAAKPLACSLYVVSSVQEEIGLRGAQTSAFGIAPHVAIAVDVTHATDCPTIDKRQRGSVTLGKGPVIFRGPNMNHAVADRLEQIAAEHGLPYQSAALGRAAPNDANALQISRSGVATGLVAIPNRYMHSAVEMVSLGDLDVAADLLAEFVTSLAITDAFIPV